jgi:hypothetical protein
LGLVDPLCFKTDCENTIEYIEAEINDEEPEPLSPARKSPKKIKKQDSIHTKMKQLKEKGTPTDLKKHTCKNKYRLTEVTDGVLPAT